MNPTTFVVDSTSSKLTIRTRASGMLARLAHDLELHASDVRGQAVRENGGFSGELFVPVAGLRVAGVLHGDRVDTSGLSSSDRLEIERKIREEVFLGTKEVHVRGRGHEWDKVEVTVESPLGKMSMPISIRGTEADGRVRVAGRTEVFMTKLGLREVKGPLGAFKLKDAIEVNFEITLQPAG